MAIAALTWAMYTMTRNEFVFWGEKTICLIYVDTLPPEKCTGCTFKHYYGHMVREHEEEYSFAKKSIRCFVVLDLFVNNDGGAIVDLLLSNFLLSFVYFVPSNLCSTVELKML